MISSCIEMIYNEDECWSAKDSTKKEMMEFVEQMNTKQFKEIEKFFGRDAKTYTYYCCKESQH